MEMFPVCAIQCRSREPLRQLNIWNMASVIEDLYLKFYVMLTILSLNNSMWLVSMLY